MVAFAVFAIFYPGILTGSENPTIAHYFGSLLWGFGVLGIFIFVGWGVMPHVVSSITRPIEIEAEKGWLKENGYGNRTLKAVSVFKLLNIYIQDDQ